MSITLASQFTGFACMLLSIKLKLSRFNTNSRDTYALRKAWNPIHDPSYEHNRHLPELQVETEKMLPEFGLWLNGQRMLYSFLLGWTTALVTAPQNDTSA